MKNKNGWTYELEDELMEFIEEQEKKGIQIRTAAEYFALKYPQFSAEQARTRFYGIRRTLRYNKKNKEPPKPWIEEENETLLNYIESNQHKKGKLQIFEELSVVLNRNANAINGHYYTLIQKKDNIKQLDTLLELINKTDIKKLIELNKMLELINNIITKIKE